MKPRTITTVALALTFVVGLSTVAPVLLLGRLAPNLSPVQEVAGTESLNLPEGRIRYQEMGEGSDAILLLHGFNGQLAHWNSTWAHLNDCGRSLRIDVPGYGGSTWPADSYSIPEQAARIIEFLDALQVRQVTLVGVSMGGSLAAWIAARYPERVRGLVVGAASGWPGSLDYHPRSFGRLLGPGWLNSLATRVAASPLYRKLYPESAALQALTVTASYNDDWALALRDIRVHAWVLWSRGDKAIPFSVAERVAGEIPDSTLVPLAENVGHSVPGDRPELFARLACQVQAGAEPAHIMADLNDSLKRNGDG